MTFEQFRRKAKRAFNEVWTRNHHKKYLSVKATAKDCSLPVDGWHYPGHERLEDTILDCWAYCQLQSDIRQIEERRQHSFGRSWARETCKRIP